MKWFLDLTTRSKLFLGFGMMVAFLAIAIGTAYLGIAEIRASQKNLYEEDFANALGLSDLRSDLNGVRAAQLTMMVLTNLPDQERWRRDANDRSKEIETTMRRLLERGRSDTRLFTRLEELKAVHDAYEQTRATQINPLTFEGKLDEAKKLALGIQAERFGKMRAIAHELGGAAVENARAAVARSESRAQQAVRAFGIIGIAAVLLAATIALLLNRVIALPLQAVSGIAARVASGDLTVNVPEDDRADEVGALVRAFRAMLENLREQIRGLIEGANVLGSAASEIVASTTQLAASASESAAAVSETTTTVEEVRQTAQVASQKAKLVSDSAQKAAQISQGGRKSTEDVVAGMNRIRQQMEAIAASMVRLSEQSQTIGQIIATVEDLAAQSNLLAVNAAIEAAKAGEHGKGFGVVAQEVKSLAEQSRQATTQVRTILGDIQKATAAAVMATEQGGKAVEAGTRQTEVAGESIQALAGSVNEAAQAATQIAASSQQQLVGVDQVAGAMESIKQASAQNVAGAKQLETAARNLNELGQRLKQMVGRYKV
jgi:methyl-accepting chemotaxis protein